MDEQEIKNILEDHENRLTILEGNKAIKSKLLKEEKITEWYRKGSTTEKIISLGNFFNQPKTVKDILDKLKEKDYHFKASDITLPLRNCVRKGALKKTRTLNDGTKIKKWAYLSS